MLTESNVPIRGVYVCIYVYLYVYIYIRMRVRSLGQSLSLVEREEHRLGHERTNLPAQSPFPAVSYTPGDTCLSLER